MWFSGQPNPNSLPRDGGNTVRQYVAKVIKWATGSKGTAEQASAPSGMPSVGHGAFTAQQAGYQAETRTGAYGAPVNPYKLPGWIASQGGGGAAAGGTGTVQADWTDTLTGGSSGVPWDGVSTVVLSTLFVLGGIGLVVVGLVQSVSPALKSAATTAASLTPEGAAVGAAKGAAS
jgi:hypothetical protein